MAHALTGLYHVEVCDPKSNVDDQISDQDIHVEDDIGDNCDESEERGKDAVSQSVQIEEDGGLSDPNTPPSTEVGNDIDLVVESLDNVNIGSGSRVSEQSNRFANLDVKDKLKTKGRPRRKSKQVTFNKCLLTKSKLSLAGKLEVGRGRGHLCLMMKVLEANNLLVIY